MILQSNLHQSETDTDMRHCEWQDQVSLPRLSKYFKCLCIYTYTILPKVLGRPLLMNRFDYFSNFYEYKS